MQSDWAKCVAEVPGATLQAVAARSPEKAAAFAQEHGVKQSLGSYAELVASDDVDVVYIGTITSLHKEILHLRPIPCTNISPLCAQEHTLLAIAAGKHVLCEKPLAETAAGVLTILDLDPIPFPRDLFFESHGQVHGRCMLQQRRRA